MLPRPLAALLVIVLSISLHAFGDDTKIAPVNLDLAAADQLYNSGKFTEAIDKYQALLKADPKLVAAQAGLVRCLLREQKVDDAFTTASSALAAQPTSPPLLAAMGDVYFRRGDMTEAETSYLKAAKTDQQLVAAYLGLARVYRAYSMYRHAYDLVQAAYKIAPNDPQVQRAWFRQGTRKQEIAAIEAYLAAPHPNAPEQVARLQERLAHLKALAEKPVHACQLVNKVEETEAKLEPMLRDPTHAFGEGLVVKLNDHSARLLLDTGAGGITVGHKAAEKAGLTRLSGISFRGVGDQGPQSGYLAVADHIRVGELEFSDCVVMVSDRNSVADEDGLIGADVFRSYLIDIDMPDRKLRLSPLPKRPDETATPAGLSTGQEGAGDSDAKAEAVEEEHSTGGEKSNSSSTTPLPKLPHDRYVAPEMAKWTPVFRFGHALLIPTHVNDSPSMLFLIDTGAAANMISRQAASTLTKVSIDPYTHVKGANGNVANVYRADKATLTFGHLRQKNLDMIAFDLSNLSRGFGTEVSGTLGFSLLSMLQVKIDYRDGLVDFVYDANRFGTGHP